MEQKLVDSKGRLGPFVPSDTGYGKYNNMAVYIGRFFDGD